MGQLEKYGLYVLCLVIFLILGVAIWGGDPAGAQPMGNPVVQQPNRQPQNEVGLSTSATPVEELIDQIQENGPQPMREVLPGPVSLDREETPPVDRNQPEPGPVTPQPGVDRKIYTIAKGDNFSRIAQRLYGDHRLYLLLQKVNPGVDSSDLDIDQKIRLPSESELRAFKAKGSSATASRSGSRLYTVRRGDSFWKIAANELGDGTRHQEIADLNAGVSSDDLDIDQVIRIPAR